MVLVIVARVPLLSISGAAYVVDAGEREQSISAYQSGPLIRRSRLLSWVNPISLSELGS